MLSKQVLDSGCKCWATFGKLVTVKCLSFLICKIGRNNGANPLALFSYSFNKYLSTCSVLCYDETVNTAQSCPPDIWVLELVLKLHKCAQVKQLREDLCVASMQAH